MPQISITEVTGVYSEVGPDTTTNIDVSCSGDSNTSVEVGITESPVNVNVSVSGSGDYTLVSGQSSIEEISVKVYEGLRTGIAGEILTGNLYPISFSYNAGGQLIQKNTPTLSTSYSYNADGSLYQASGAIVKTFLYDSGGQLTGISV